MGVNKTQLDAGVEHTDLDIVGKGFQAAIACKGANLYHWQAGQSQQPILYHSPLAKKYPNSPLRGGIPLIGPWFAAYSALRERPVLPSDIVPMAHGFLRDCQWKILDKEILEDGNAQQVTLGITAADWQQQLLQRAPQMAVCLDLLPSFDATVQYRISATNLNTTLTYQAHKAGIFEAALHTYLRVENICDYRLEGLEGQRYLDATLSDPNGLYGFTERREQGAIEFGEMVDRIYEYPGSALILRPNSDGCVKMPVIEIDNGKAEQVVVWNIGPQAVKNLADMPATDWNKYVCVEAANIRQGAFTLAAGEEFSLQQNITLHS